MLDELKSSRPRTRSPASRWCFARFDPRKPAAPVTRTFFMARPYFVLAVLFRVRSDVSVQQSVGQLVSLGFVVKRVGEPEGKGALDDVVQNTSTFSRSISTMWLSVNL